MKALKCSFLGANITIGSYESFIDQIFNLAQARISSYVCVMNVHMLVEAHQDKNFAQIVNEADVTTPDGMPLAKGIKLIHGFEQDRVAGMDLLPDLLKEAERKNLKVFFYGGTHDIQTITGEYVHRVYSGLKTTGFHSPPFRPLTIQEEEEVIKKINDSGTNLVFVALGCPKQEKWMASMKGRIHACMVGIGGALPVMVGMQKRAPKWMQKYSLEWLYRLYQEPGRLWKRYFYTNTLFLFLFVKEFLKSRVSSRRIANN